MAVKLVRVNGCADRCPYRPRRGQVELKYRNRPTGSARIAARDTRSQHLLYVCVCNFTTNNITSMTRRIFADHFCASDDDPSSAVYDAACVRAEFRRRLSAQQRRHVRHQFSAAPAAAAAAAGHVTRGGAGAGHVTGSVRGSARPGSACTCSCVRRVCGARACRRCRRRTPPGGSGRRRRRTCIAASSSATTPERTRHVRQTNGITSSSSSDRNVLSAATFSKHTHTHTHTHTSP